MKFQIGFKTPDAVQDKARELAKQLLPEGLSDAEEDDFIATKIDEILEFSMKWIRYGECVTLEFDTEKDTAVVVERCGQ